MPQQRRRRVEVNFCDRAGGFRPEYQSCRQYEVRQQAVASRCTGSEAANKVCVSLIQILVKQGRLICICN